MILILPSYGGRRLGRSRHCSKGAQPVPKAVYHSGRHDKHHRPRYDSNLGPLTPQSDALTSRLLRPDRCDTEMNRQTDTGPCYTYNAGSANNCCKGKRRRAPCVSRVTDCMRLRTVAVLLRFQTLLLLVGRRQSFTAQPRQFYTRVHTTTDVKTLKGKFLKTF